MRKGAPRLLCIAENGVVNTQIVFVLMGLLFLAGCFERASKAPRENDAVCPSSTFLIPMEQMNNIKKKAKTGDGDAAYRLYWHYMLGEYEPRKAMYWLKKAVAAGNVDAKVQLEAENRANAMRLRR